MHRVVRGRIGQIEGQRFPASSIGAVAGAALFNGHIVCGFRQTRAGPPREGIAVAIGPLQGEGLRFYRIGLGVAGHLPLAQLVSDGVGLDLPMRGEREVAFHPLGNDNALGGFGDAFARPARKVIPLFFGGLQGDR